CSESSCRCCWPCPPFRRPWFARRTRSPRRCCAPATCCALPCGTTTGSAATSPWPPTARWCTRCTARSRPPAFRSPSS
ncbi:MAG: hypothetical protein AVDCRST_MAG89-418, partial [uncultured Gemmatimonadetes bacterium]